MLTADVRFEGWTTEDWQRFLRLWKPRASAELESTRPRGGLLAIHDGARFKKVLHTAQGRVDPREHESAEGRESLRDLAERHGASWAVSAHVGALDEIMERFGARSRREHDLVAQSLNLVTIVREMIGEGEIESWPRRLRGFPVPTVPMVRRTIDALSGDGRAITLGMFQGGELYTAFVARRRGAGFDVIAGPDELRPAMGLLSGDWRRDYRHLVRAVEDRYAPLAFGCFAEVESFRDLQTDGRPGAWGRAVAFRDIVLSPIPTAVGFALGVDGARYAFESVKKIISQLDPFGFLDPVMHSMRKRLGSPPQDGTLPLGFNPMAALRALLKR